MGSERALEPMQQENSRIRIAAEGVMQLETVSVGRDKAFDGGTNARCAARKSPPERLRVRSA